MMRECRDIFIGLHEQKAKFRISGKKTYMEEPVNKVALSFSLNFVVLTISLQKMRRSQGATNFIQTQWMRKSSYLQEAD